MAALTSTETIQRAFPEHWTRIAAAIAAEPSNLPQLFADLSEYVLSLKDNVDPQSQTNAKKRKLENEPLNDYVVPQAVSSRQDIAVFECNDVSVQVPVRKKMRVSLVHDDQGEKQSITLVDQASLQTGFTVPIQEIEEVFGLPMPDKQVRQTNFVVFPKRTALDVTGKALEQMVFVMNDAPVSGAVKFSGGISEHDTFITVTQRALDAWLHAYGKRVVTPSGNEFASSIPQSHRKGEKAYHVRAHRGSKEGYLFFLENGIVFGFKKPLAFFPFSVVDSISYTSVLQRTFNLVIAARDLDSDAVNEIEFSMLDQEDFAGIDGYIKKHGLNDASMAAQRRAKAYNVNKERKAEGVEDLNGGVEEDDGQTELQKAEQQLQDEEDELEEDYEVSGGESEGEGEESEEEDEAYDDEEVEEVDAAHED